MTGLDEAGLGQLALRLLADREHSRAELRRKLAARAERPEAVEPLLDRLTRQGLQSDRRFAEAYLQGRLRRGFGPVRIRLELRERGVVAELVDAVFADADVDWAERLAQVAERKFGPHPPADPRERARRARFLEYRGFPHEQIRELM